MSFQRARTEEQIAGRQEEIINACDAIYQSKGFESVNFKVISEMTSIARPSIYNYYQTKEEIFLDLLKREYLSWCNTLKSKFDFTDTMTKEEYCLFLTATLQSREKLLNLLSIHYTSIEKNCSLGKLEEFKQDIQPVFQIFREGLDKFFLDASDENKSYFQFLFFSLLNGLYPMTHLTEKQTKAMKKAVPDYTAPKFEEMFYKGILLLASDL